MNWLTKNSHLLVDATVVVFFAYVIFGDAPQGCLNLAYAFTALFALGGIAVAWDEDPKRPKYPQWTDHAVRTSIAAMFVYVGWWWCALGWFISWLGHAVKWHRLESKND